MVESLAILTGLLFAGVAVACPGIGYAIGLARARRRSPEAGDYFVSQQRAMLVSFYKVTFCAGVPLVVGMSITGTTQMILALIVGVTLLCPALLVLVAMVPVGLTMSVALVLCAGEPLPGCCAKCDYDLRGSPDCRCPECGYAGAAPQPAI